MGAAGGTALENHEGVQSDLNNSFREGPPPKQAACSEEAAETEEEISIGRWLLHNGPILGAVIVLLVWLWLKFDVEGLWAIGKAALGLSFVIFIHELGHFAVAKWCDVHVTTFSIGFGPAIPGCRFKWGETTYKLALFPLGGYVQMVGQVDADESSDGSEEDPRSYRNKTVFQRMAIISAGVIMNVILAIICFIVVFQGPGKDRQAAVVSRVDTGAPAFVKGVRSGAEILQIGEVSNPYFENLMVRVMASGRGEKLTFVSQRPEDAEPITLHIEPRLDKKDHKDSKAMLGIGPADSLQLASRRMLDVSYSRPVAPGTPAESARGDFLFDDRIIATTDPDQDGTTYDPHKLTELPVDSRKTKEEGGLQRDFFEFRKRMKQMAGKEIVIQVAREGKKEPVSVVIEPAFHSTLGLRMEMGQITAVRENSPGAKAGVRPRSRVKDLEGDQIIAVEVAGADGTTTVYKGKTLDPVRLPYQLRQWADAYLRSKRNPADMRVTLQVKRHNEEQGPQYSDKTLQLEWDDGWKYDELVPFNAASPLAIPELGIAFQVKTTIAGRDPLAEGFAADALPVAGEIKECRFYSARPNGESKPTAWFSLKSDQWANVFYQLQMYPGAVKKIDVKVEFDKEIKEHTLTVREDKSWPLAGERGLILKRDLRRQKADNMAHAVALGFTDTYNSVVQVFQAIVGMATGRISVDQLGGPLTIANVAYRFAGYDFWEFIFFLGLISINLAVINALPIPVLDGGHMVFLLYEKLRGKPASEGVRIGATYAGLALILCLMGFVLYLDFSRIFGG